MPPLRRDGVHGGRRAHRPHRAGAPGSGGAFWDRDNIALAGELLKLLPFQRRFIYGVMRHHEAALTIARGNGKTTLAAATIAGPLAAPRAQTIVVAASLGQARIAFSHAIWFLRPSKTERKRWRIIENTYDCRIEDRETGAMMRTIGSLKPAERSRLHQRRFGVLIATKVLQIIHK